MLTKEEIKMSYGLDTQDRDIQIGNKHFKQSEIGFAIETWRNNPKWLKSLGRYYEKLYRGVGHWMELIGLQSISGSLPFIPYGNELIRSCINLFCKGGWGFGKGLLITLAQDLMPRVQRLNSMTSAALLGAINKKGEWVPGEAYWARYGILAIPELFQTIRRGEHFEGICEHLCEILEYPHHIRSSRVTFSISDIASTMQYYEGVSFPQPNIFEYDTPECGLIATAEFSLPVLLQKLSSGFLSRFVDIPIAYSTSEADEAVRNYWNTVLIPTTENDTFDKDTFRRLFYIVWWFNMGWGKDMFGIPPITSYSLPVEHRNTLEKESLEVMKEAWKKLDKKPEEEKELSSIPVFIRESQDLLRIVCADAASRRFETDEHLTGVIEIDEEAVKTGLEYFYTIAISRVNMAIEYGKIIRQSSLGESYINDPCYQIIKESGKQGIFQVEVVEAMKRSPFNWNDRRTYRRIEKLRDVDKVITSDGRRLWARVALIKERGGLFI